jgi:hypothetical protein
MTKAKQKQRKLIAQKKAAKHTPMDKPINPIAIDIVDTLFPEHQSLLKRAFKSNEGLITALTKYKELKEIERK